VSGTVPMDVDSKDVTGRGGDAFFVSVCLK
jgi:hypothetical protein